MFDCCWFSGNQPQPGVRASVSPHPSLPAPLPLTPPQSRAQPSLHREKQKMGREEAITVGRRKRQQNQQNTGVGGEEGRMTGTLLQRLGRIHMSRSGQGNKVPLYPAPSLPTPFSPEPIKGPGGLRSISIGKSWTQLKRLSIHTCTQG